MTQPETLTRQEKIANCVKSLTAKPDFPTFSQHVQAILSAVDQDGVSARELTRLVLRDYSLSLILLRRANAYNYSGRSILSITHAVVMLGIEAVRNLAAGLLIFDHFQHKPAAVRELMTLSMLTAGHVQQIATRVPAVHPEEAYLCGLVRNLGEVLISYYLPADYASILKLASERKQHLTRSCLELLGFSFEDLGEAVARYWGMPERVAECQRAAVPRRFSDTSRNSLLMAAVSLGHEMTTALYRVEPEGGHARLKACLEDHCTVLPLTRQEIDRMLEKSLAETRATCETLGVHINELRLQAQTQSVLEALACRQSAEPVKLLPSKDGDTLEALTREVSAMVATSADLDLNSLILMVLEAIYRGAGFERVLFAFVTPDQTRIEGRLGLGDDVDSLIERFSFPTSAGTGPVSTALLARRSIIADQANPIARLFGCSSMGLYPIVVAGQVVGCIYMESREPRPALALKDLRQLNQLRDSVVTAMLQVRAAH